MHTLLKVRFISIVFSLFIFIYPVSHSRAQTLQEHVQKRVGEKWDIEDMMEKYPMSGVKVLKIIERCYPHEIDTLLAMGARDMTLQEWGDAKFWYDVVRYAKTDHIEVFYRLGIVERENGHEKVFFLRHFNFQRAKKHFQKVIALDSTYKDVYYQWAILEWYDKHYDNAIELAQRQFAVNPFSYDALLGIFRFYGAMVHHWPFEKAEAWLKARNTHYDVFALGELYRLSDRSVQADSVYRALLADPGDFSLPLAGMSMVRLYVQNDEPEKAEEIYWQAVDGVSNALETELVMKDFLYIVNEEEYDILKNLPMPEVLGEVLREFWLRRNPMPAAAYNHRLIEHYRRLIYAEKKYYYNGLSHPMFASDDLGVFRFPPWYYESRSINDQGLIYVRFGDPDDREFVVDEDIPTNVAWFYYEADNTPPMIFHFEVQTWAQPGYLTLTPFPSDVRIVEALHYWDPQYYRLYQNYENSQEQFRISREIEMLAMETVELAMRTDRHTWPDKTDLLDMVYDIVRFRNSDEQDIVQLAFAIPLSRLLESDNGPEGVDLETGVAVFDDRMETLYKDTRDYSVRNTSDRHIWNEWFIDEFEFPLDLGTVNIAIHGQAPELKLVDGWQYEYILADSARDHLSCSSLKMAFHIESSKGTENPSRQDLKIMPNPTRKFQIHSPVFVYYEVYNLAFDEQGTTRYSITFTLKESGEKDFLQTISGLFGSGRDYQISVESEQTGESRTVSDYIVFDMGSAKKGKYELVLQVRDRIAGEEAVVSSKLELVE